MHPFSMGILSLVSPIDIPSHKSREAIETLVWQSVGDCLREALSEYGKTKEYEKALTEQTY